jgi:hypothetical protein
VLVPHVDTIPAAAVHIARLIRLDSIRYSTVRERERPTVVQCRTGRTQISARGRSNYVKHVAAAGRPNEPSG